MSRTKNRMLDAETLWCIARVGAPALSPDGRQVVCSVSTTDIDKNQNQSHLWLLHSAGEKPPRQLTGCGGKDGQAAWSPQGDSIAFVARREQAGEKDSAPQLYLIAPDGGEARRAGRFGHFGPGVESFKWMPDGQGIVFAAWVWPHLKTSAAQHQQHQRWAARKESGYATSQAYYRYWDHNLPQGRALHLLLLDVRGRHAGRITDLFAGTGLELPRHDESSLCYDVHPSGQRIAFVHDPAPVQQLGNPLALSELNLKTRHITALVQDPAWDFAAPRYSPDGQRIAAIAAHVGRVHTALGQLALVHQERDGPGRWQALGADWDHDVEGPLRWAANGQAIYFKAEARGRCHLWQHKLVLGQFSVLHQGGWVQHFDAAADTLALAADSAQFPTRLYALHAQHTQDTQGTQGTQGVAAAAQRLDTFNDALWQGLTLGRVHEVTVQGARDKPSGRAVQMWLTFPPGFDPQSAAGTPWPVTHVIHGGPYAAAGDTFGFRWNTQVLAAHGHVVAQVNYHGSSGFGHAFRHSLIGRQGALELQDIEAGTDWLLQQPWADASRVFATGGSYGGFLVAWMNGHVPAAPQGLQSRYRAYVCHAGVFDRVATFSADSYPVRPKDLAANFWQNMPRVLAQSPHAFAGQMHTPTLVIHGAQDYRVPDCNGLAYFNTLKARGVDARLLWFPDENHWVLKPQNSLQWYAEFLAWLDRFGAPPKRTKATTSRRKSAVQPSKTPSKTPARKRPTNSR